MLGTVAAAIRTPELKEITWRSEMKKRCVVLHFSSLLVLTDYALLRPLEELDPRLSFSNFARRAGLLDEGASSKS